MEWALPAEPPLLCAQKSAVAMSSAGHSYAADTGSDQSTSYPTPAVSQGGACRTDSRVKKMCSSNQSQAASDQPLTAGGQSSEAATGAEPPGSCAGGTGAGPGQPLLAEPGPGPGLGPGATGGTAHNRATKSAAMQQPRHLPADHSKATPWPCPPPALIYPHA